MNLFRYRLLQVGYYVTLVGLYLIMGFLVMDLLPRYPVVKMIFEISIFLIYAYFIIDAIGKRRKRIADSSTYYLQHSSLPEVKHAIVEMGFRLADDLRSRKVFFLRAGKLRWLMADIKIKEEYLEVFLPPGFELDDSLFPRYDIYMRQSDKLVPRKA